MRVAVVIPARNEAERIAATVQAAARIAGVHTVLVVDDGSTDNTAAIAEAAGARAVRHPRNRGKAAAMTTGAAAVPDAEVLLFLDADLGDTASGAGPLLPPVLEGRADMTIATLPTQATAGGGHGFVVRLARAGIQRATGFAPVQPLSGQRALSRVAFGRALPLAAGFGVETALTIDLLRAGLHVQEVRCDLQHRVTGTDWRAQRHRLRQFVHVARALAARGRWRRAG
ncbi:MAG TPA: glycosyltransferase [Sporichthyaceae bacterium]|nr:glycosyltransferase [Sporichthyaceae bacterium]